jgi:hypothetical protein
MWKIMRGRTPLYRSPYYDAADLADDPGLHDEMARVPHGPPRTPPQSGAVALPLPESEDRDLDASGPAADASE